MLPPTISVRHRSHTWFIVLLILTGIVPAQVQTNPAAVERQWVELGQVHWLRNYEQARRQARQSGRAIFILFQEVPGCATCRNFGRDVLSRPLMVAAIENEFVPLAIHNNKSGHDARILNQFREAAWNNPVVRIVTDQGVDLVPRLAGDYRAIAVYRTMTAALNAQSRPIPQYMQLLGAELHAANKAHIQTDYFSMNCFWSGEAALGAIQGVLDTRAGFMHGQEVVKVIYDTQTLSRDGLVRQARQLQFTRQPVDGTWRHAVQDEDYYLQQSPLRYLNLSRLQATRINSSLGLRQNPMIYLSPDQRKIADSKK
ncbi:MAG: thioredoxin family protein [Leptospiraceae bacterium]|nr:thioredoxin family protein [Leptospiraceae bacterium]